MFDRMLPAIRSTGRSDHIDLVLALRRDQEVGIHVAAVEQVGSRQQSRAAKSCAIVGPIVQSGVVAGVVSTCVISSGCSGSQVSVRWSL